ncbi:MAG: flagella basal body P-ring formation protein FlgA [Proteobacteria bacterium]|nr:MAG: flagella basal body P-ring formation protein FlgA [Pseudomonadota bacterium]
MTRAVVTTALALLLASLTPSPSRAAEDAPRWVEDRIQAFLLERVPEGPVRVAIPPLGDFALEGVDPETAAVEIATDAEEPLRGRVSLTVSVVRGDEVLARRTVPVEIEEATVALVAVRALARGAVLREGDVALRPVAGASDRRAAVSDAGEVAGRRLRRSVPAGTPLRAAWLEDVPLVRRGEPVRLSLVSGALRIEATGLARQDGRAGEIVRVESQTSRREVIGRVGTDGVVHVAF